MTKGHSSTHVSRWSFPDMTMGNWQQSCTTYYLSFFSFLFFFFPFFFNSSSLKWWPSFSCVLFVCAEDTDNYDLFIEGACLSTLRETETGVDVVRVNRTGLNYHVDTHLLPDQGTESILLKTNLSFRMQGITTSRILALRQAGGGALHKVWVCMWIEPL